LLLNIFKKIDGSEEQDETSEKGDKKDDCLHKIVFLLPAHSGRVGSHGLNTDAKTRAGYGGPAGQA